MDWTKRFIKEIMQIEEFIKILEEEFEKNASPEKALGQKAYMKDNFDFYGLTTPERREIQKPLLHILFYMFRILFKIISHPLGSNKIYRIPP